MRILNKIHGAVFVLLLASVLCCSIVTAEEIHYESVIEIQEEILPEPGVYSDQGLDESEPVQEVLPQQEVYYESEPVQEVLPQQELIYESEPVQEVLPQQEVIYESEPVQEVLPQQEIIYEPDPDPVVLPLPEISPEPESEERLPQQEIMPDPEPAGEILPQPEVSPQAEPIEEVIPQSEILPEPEPSEEFVPQPEVSTEPESVAEALPKQDILSEPQPVSMFFLPLELKTELPESIASNTFCSVLLEIKNTTNQNLDQLTVTLRSKVPGVYITCYKNKEEALEQMTKPPVTEEEKQKATERTIRIPSLRPGESIKTEIVLYAEQDIMVDEIGLDAEIYCTFYAGNVLFDRKDTWKMMLPEEHESEQELPMQIESENSVLENLSLIDTENFEPEDLSVIKAEDTEPEDLSVIEAEDAEPEDLSLIGAENTESEIPSLIETENSEAENAEPETPSPIKLTNINQEPAEEGGEEELITVDVIQDGEEETIEDEIYWDDYYSGDWSYYSGIDETQPVNTATPYLLVKSYAHKKEIHTGDTFALEVTFLNTSQKVGMENIVIKVETSDAISLANGTNTIFINSMDAGATSVQHLDMTAATEVKEPNQNVSFSVTFEYIENKERKQGTASESVILPIAQKDRLEMQDPSIDYMEAGSEGVISIPYVNKGYSSLYNMEATIFLDGADAIQNSVYAGNVESGKSGTLDFVITPWDEGEYNGTVTVSYEDGLQKHSSIDIPIRFTSYMAYVEEDYTYQDFEYTEEPEPEGIPYLWFIVGGAAVLIAVIMIFVIRRRKKAKKEDLTDADDWFREDLQTRGDA